MLTRAIAKPFGRCTVAVAMLTMTPVAFAQSIFLVRHAERADAGMAAATTMATDPDLSDAGRARAETLATMLKDARITAIFTTEYKRTQQTAVPLAKRLGIQPQTISAKDAEGLVAKVKAAGGNVLVIGHSNTIPDVLKRLGVEIPVKIGDGDYDDLFVVTAGQKPTMVRLHYGS